MDQATLKLVARRIAQEGGKTVALTGAGISVESGIPDFRSAGGLWERYDPMEYGTIDAFQADPEKVWKMLRELEGVIVGAKPNPAHLALARLEARGLLSAIITQNIDNLHQAAGSKKVIEFHGNASRLVCLSCQASRSAAEVRADPDSGFPPRCPACRAILKPDVVLFGEPIPEEAGREAMRLSQVARVFLIVGTSATVAPASYLPVVARKMGALLVEVNVEDTVLSEDFVHHTLQGRAGEVLPVLVDEVEAVAAESKNDP
jgi:NAD-dependent deacetylase